MFILYESLGLNQPRLITRHATFAEAYADLSARCALVELDFEYADCADGLGETGALYSVEPQARRPHLWNPRNGGLVE